ncbi:hypothetical protein B0H19DRAFT_1238758 [Mycena capillaripes]|nr:hypothetical protein B0H19DRAFT_1238758 [Mycena capillaripes]
MLQIPSSVLALFSSSSKGIVGLLGGLCIGTQVAVNLVLYGSKTEFSVVRATPTIEIVVPTRCVLSNDTLSFPYVAAMGYAIVIFLGLFCMLRAKGFASASSSGSVPSHQPPVPPSDPGSNSSADKRRRRCRRIYWLTLLLAALIVLVIRVFFAYYAPSHPVHPILLPFHSVGLQVLSLVDLSLSYLRVSVARNISTLTAHLSLLGRQYRRILLLALASHFASILLTLAFRRVCRRLIILPANVWSGLIVVIFAPFGVIASIPQLRWIYWMIYYTASWREPVPDVRQILLLIYRFSALVDFLSVDAAMVVAPVIIHAVTTSLWTVVVGLLGIPCTARAVFQLLSLPGLLRFLVVFSVNTTVFIVVFFLFASPTVHYDIMYPHERDALWRSFPCPESRAQTLQLFSYFLRRFQTWRSDQIANIPAFISGLQDAFKAGFNVAWETLSSRPLRYSTYISTSSPLPADFRESDGEIGSESTRQTDGYFDDQKTQERFADSRHHARGNRRGARTGHEDRLGRLTIFAISQLAAHPASPPTIVLSVALPTPLGSSFLQRPARFPTPERKIYT